MVVGVPLSETGRRMVLRLSKTPWYLSKIQKDHLNQRLWKTYLKKSALDNLQHDLNSTEWRLDDFSWQNHIIQKKRYDRSESDIHHHLLKLKSATCPTQKREKS